MRKFFNDLRIAVANADDCDAALRELDYDPADDDDADECAADAPETAEGEARND